MATKFKNTQDTQHGFDPNKPMFPISVIADILKVHQRTLRIYDDENILVPSRSPKNRRLYSFNDIERGKFIQYLTRELGINLAGIKIIIYLLRQQSIDPNKFMEHISDVVKEISASLEMLNQDKVEDDKNEQEEEKIKPKKKKNKD